MAKQQLTEEKVSKLLSFILSSIFSGKGSNVVSKVSKDKDLAKKINDVDKSYKELMSYFEKKIGKDELKAAIEKSDKVLRQRGFNV